MSDTIAHPAASGPALACPAWCTQHYPGEILGKIRVSAVHRTVTRYFGPLSVAVMQVAVEGMAPMLSFDSVDVSLRDAQRLADTMRRLRHEDIAAAIRELVALVQAEPAEAGAR